MVGVQQAKAFHTDTDHYGRRLSPTDRERLLRPYLPTAPQQVSSQPIATGPRFHHRQRVRPALRQLIYHLIFTLIHAAFSIYIHVRQVYHAILDRILAVLYYHHRTPELIKRDVKSLSKVPKHLSVILEVSPAGGKKDRLESVVNDACEIAAWSGSAGIEMLSIYERTGILKSSLPHFHRRVERTLTAYFGATSPTKPTVSLRAPHLPSYDALHTPEPLVNGMSDAQTPPKPHLDLLLISESDGRQTLVDLTKTLADMSQQNKLSPSDISSELIDAEITESVMAEPDLLICFGNRVVLDGYPPWQIRLTEIFYVPDNVGGVGYHIFLQALYKFAKAEMRFGR